MCDRLTNNESSIYDINNLNQRKFVFSFPLCVYDSIVFNIAVISTHKPSINRLLVILDGIFVKFHYVGLLAFLLFKGKSSLFSAYQCPETSPKAEGFFLLGFSFP